MAEKITKVSKEALELIKKFEGFCAQPYLCPANVPTIGYGATFYEDGTKVKATDPAINEERATQLLKNVLKTFEKHVDSYTRDDITQHQFDALVCFAYNVGVGALKSSTLLKVVNTNPSDVARCLSVNDVHNVVEWIGLLRLMKIHVDVDFTSSFDQFTVAEVVDVGVTVVVV